MQTACIILTCFLVTLCAKTSVQILYGDKVGNENVDGELINNGEFPYIAQLNVYLVRQVGHTTFRRNLTCGASIIGDNVLLTAGHCVKNVEVGEIVVKAGILNSQFPEDTAQVFTVKKISVHKEYNNPSTYNNDIALVWLNKSITKNTFVSPIELANEDDEEVGQQVTVAGWGINERGVYTDSLHKATLVTIANDECQGYTISDVTENMLCATSEDIGISCRGDSGGPVVADKKLIGIISWVMEFIYLPSRRQTCKLGLPDVFVRISKYRKWIDSELQNEKAESN